MNQGTVVVSLFLFAVAIPATGFGRVASSNKSNRPVHAGFAARGQRMKSLGAPQEPCYTEPRNDGTDQIHYETARQSRSALGIGLIIRI